MKTYLTLVAVALLCASCGILTPQQRDALEVLAELYRVGTLTREQFEVLSAALQGGGWMEQIGEILLGGALGYAGVQLRRGPSATADERAKRIEAKAHAVATKIAGETK